MGRSNATQDIPVVLARRAIALMGNWEIEWSAVGEAASWFRSKGYKLPLASRGGNLGHAHRIFWRHPSA